MSDLGTDNICECGHKHRDHHMFSGTCGWELCRCDTYAHLFGNEQEPDAESYMTVSQERAMSLVMDAAKKFAPDARWVLGEPECSDPDCLICRPIGMDE